MTAMHLVRIVLAVATIGFGLVSALSPKSAESFTGLAVTGPRGTSEIRAVLGGLFIGLGLAALIYRTPSAYGTLGIGYLAIAVVRAASILGDKAFTSSNGWSLASEIVFGVLLLVGK